MNFVTASLTRRALLCASVDLKWFLNHGKGAAAPDPHTNVMEELRKENAQLKRENYILSLIAAPRDYEC